MSKRGFLFLACVGSAFASAGQLENRLVRIEVQGNSKALWKYTLKSTGRSFAFGPPTFELDGRAQTAALTSIRSRQPTQLPNGATEHRFEGSFLADKSLSLELVLRFAPDNPVVRFRYTLHSAEPRSMTKSSGKDAITYLRTSVSGLSRFQEVRFSDFSEQSHSYTLNEMEVDARHFDNEVPLFGPVFTGCDTGHSALIAYEHGSELPNAFVQFLPGRDRSLSLAAVKGNYYTGQVLGPERPYETLWFDAAVVKGGLDELAGAFRSFMLKYQSQERESRKPYILFDTWNYQERDKWWNKRTYLASMTEKRVLAEIEVAAKLGVDIFYLDAGWFEKTGDWQVARSRFPNGLGPVRAALKRHGMHLGLWFDPTAAALSSSLLARHRDHIASREGISPKPRNIWEIESVTRELIRVMQEHDAKYVLLDAVHQDECSAPGHWHGTAKNSPPERGDSFAFQLVAHLARMAEQVQRTIP